MANPAKLDTTTHIGGWVASRAAHGPATSHCVGRMVHSIHHNAKFNNPCVTQPCSKTTALSAKSKESGVAIVPSIVMAYKFDTTDATENSAKNQTNNGHNKTVITACQSTNGKSKCNRRDHPWFESRAKLSPDQTAHASKVATAPKDSQNPVDSIAQGSKRTISTAANIKSWPILSEIRLR